MAPKRARLALSRGASATSNQSSSLFEGLVVYFLGKCDRQQFKRDDVMELMRRAGASICTRQPKASLFDDICAPTDDYNGKRSVYRDCRLLVLYDETLSPGNQLNNLQEELVEQCREHRVRFATLSHVLDCVGQFRLFEFDDSSMQPDSQQPPTKRKQQKQKQNAPEEQEEQEEVPKKARAKRDKKK